MADLVNLTDVMAAVTDRLTAEIDDPGIVVWATPPEVEGRLPAVWADIVAGGGPSARDRPVTVRVYWVPAQAQANAQIAPALWAAVDVLDAAFVVPLPSGVVITSRYWTRDGVSIGDVTRDCLTYDLSIIYPNC